MPGVGKEAPAFTPGTDSGDKVSLKDLRGRRVVLFFYPRDDTPGWTRETCDFHDEIAAFEAKKAVVPGISRDSAASHRRFKQEYRVPFVLFSDPDGEICERYGVLVDKNMYGKKVVETQRRTFLIDADGIVERVFEKVKVDGHAGAVLERLDAR